MYINAVSDSVMLYLHDFYNMTFKNQTSIINGLRSAPTPNKNSGCAPGKSKTAPVLNHHTVKMYGDVEYDVKHAPCQQ